jgi:hypothetical protein
MSEVLDQSTAALLVVCAGTAYERQVEIALLMPHLSVLSLSASTNLKPSDPAGRPSWRRYSTLWFFPLGPDARSAWINAGLGLNEQP